MGYSLTVEDQPDMTIPEDYPVRAVLKDIKLREYEFKDRQTGQMKPGAAFEWFFEVTADGPYHGRTVRGRTGTSLTNSAGNQLRAWAQSLLQRELPTGANLDTDDLVGLACDITVKHDPDKKNPLIKWDRVYEVLAPTAGFDLNEPPF
jgi:hypothetical protein